MTPRRTHSPLATAISVLGTRGGNGDRPLRVHPALPMMQTDHDISVPQGLAGGELLEPGRKPACHTSRHPCSQRDSRRPGAIAACTLAMGIDHHFAVWLTLRWIAGVASAVVMVVVSAWILPRLAHAAHEHLSGTVYAGVGIGIMFAGLACLVLLRIGASSDTTWVVLGLTAAIITIAVWRAFADADSTQPQQIPTDNSHSAQPT